MSTALDGHHHIVIIIPLAKTMVPKIRPDAESWDGDRRVVGPLWLSQQKKPVCGMSVSCQSRERAPMIFKRRQAGSAGIRRLVPCGPLARKRPNQDAAPQILLEDSLACRRGGGTHPAPLNSHRGRPNELQAHPRQWDGASCVWGTRRKKPLRRFVSNTNCQRHDVSHPHPDWSE